MRCRTMMIALGPITLVTVLSTYVCGATYHVDQDHAQASDDNAGTEQSP